MSSGEGAVVARGLRKDYPLGDVTVQALRGVDLDLPAGKFVVMLGPSGCGKTTLLNLIGGLDIPTAGELSAFGRRLSDLNEARLAEYRREDVGFVFQMFNLVPTLTALENVLLIEQLVGGEGRSASVLESVGLGEFGDHLPSQLSGGQQQRVAIARALVKQPRLLLADEPTGALDVQTGREVLSVLWHETRSRDMTLIMVTHNPVFAHIGDLVVTMRDGMVVEVVEGEARDPITVA
jgi:putative ABC transport system ATP-binding protein